ncbi:MAG: patatin-like phospholipase family protein, partial [Mesorhizobium sp.]
MLERNRNKAAAATIAEITAQYDRIALVFQGGGALGAYQAGVYQALADAGCEPTWLS